MYIIAILLLYVFVTCTVTLLCKRQAVVGLKVLSFSCAPIYYGFQIYKITVIHHNFTVGLSAEQSSTLSKGVACINLDWPQDYGDLISLSKCPGLYTGRSENIKGVCVDIQVNTIRGRMNRGPVSIKLKMQFPYLASTLYLSFKDLVAGRYYFDCYTFFGNTFSREVITCEY